MTSAVRGEVLQAGITELALLVAELFCPELPLKGRHDGLCVAFMSTFHAAQCDEEE
jgi:hypothetical protein